MRLLLALLFVALPLLAQETPTEREAARDVIAKMAALQKSLDVPALVASTSVPCTERSSC